MTEACCDRVDRERALWKWARAFVCVVLDYAQWAAVIACVFLAVSAALSWVRGPVGEHWNRVLDLNFGRFTLFIMVDMAGVLLATVALYLIERLLNRRWASVARQGS